VPSVLLPQRQPKTVIPPTSVEAIAAGTPPRFPRSGIPEIDVLVQSLRQMHQQLGDRFAELRREQAESAALVESMVEGVIAADGRGRIVTANPAARRLLGYAPTGALPDLPALFRVKAAREVVLPGTSWGVVGLYLLLLLALSVVTSAWATWTFRGYQRSL